MKKTIILLLACLLTLALAAGAAAESEKPLTALCDAAFELLFETGNVTLTGEANFSLDGSWFKTAKAKYIQDGDRSFWELKLSSPRKDRTIRENGYTVIADGSKIYVMEVYTPGVYKTGTSTPQSTILRESVQMDLMKILVRAAAGRMESAENSAVRVEKQENGLRIEADGPLPEEDSLALNLLAEYGAKRYFLTDYDKIGAWRTDRMSNYLTVTEGILGCTNSVALKHAEATVQLDAEGQIEAVDGSAVLLLDTAADGEHTLEITLQAAVSERGTSHVGSFVPGEYNVTLAEGSMDIEDVDNSGLDERTEAKLVNQTKELWTRAGYSLNSTVFGYAYRQNGRYCTDLVDNSTGFTLSCVSNVAGKVLELGQPLGSWRQKVFNYDDPYQDTETAEKAAGKVMEYLREINPEDMKRVDRLKLECWSEDGGELYFEFCEDPLAQDWDGVLVIVKVRPEWQVVYYSCLSNG